MTCKFIRRPTAGIHISDQWDTNLSVRPDHHLFLRQLFTLPHRDFKDILRPQEKLFHGRTIGLSHNVRRRQ